MKLERCTPELDTDWTVMHETGGAYITPDGLTTYSDESAVRYRTQAEAERVAFDRETHGDGWTAVPCCD
jgi:hypothetical protein